MKHAANITNHKYKYGFAISLFGLSLTAIVFMVLLILFFSNIHSYSHRVPAHRIILSASSAYFSAMFMGSLRETKEEEITLGEVHGEPLQALIQYCYTGTIELREDNVEILLATACLLQLSPVVNACCAFLVSDYQHVDIFI